MKIVIISGSPRQGSLSHRIALHLQQRLEKLSEHEVKTVSLQESALPPIQTVWSDVEKAPEEHKPLAKTIFEAQAFILVTPEYNGGYSPAMKNLLDHFPKQNHKPFGLVSSSNGAMGGMRAAMQTQQLVAALFGILSPYMLVTPLVDKKFDEQGNLIEPSFQRSIDNFVAEFFWLADKLVQAQ